LTLIITEPLILM